MNKFEAKKKEIATKMDKKFATNPFAKKYKHSNEMRETARRLNKK